MNFDDGYWVTNLYRVRDSPGAASGPLRGAFVPATRASRGGRTTARAPRAGREPRAPDSSKRTAPRRPPRSRSRARPSLGAWRPTSARRGAGRAEVLAACSAPSPRPARGGRADGLYPLPYASVAPRRAPQPARTNRRFARFNRKSGRPRRAKPEDLSANWQGFMVGPAKSGSKHSPTQTSSSHRRQQLKWKKREEAFEKWLVGVECL